MLQNCSTRIKKNDLIVNNATIWLLITNKCSFNDSRDVSNFITTFLLTCILVCSGGILQ